jgi:FecR protein
MEASMNASWRWGTTSLLSLLLLVPAATFASDTSSSANFVEPEIVQLAYVEGDVRLSTGDDKNGAIGKTWVEAQPGIPIEQGFNLSTAAGKAVIELEDGSVIYLADNSTLVFKELATIDDAPTTGIELVTGTATVDVHPLPKGEFVLETPNSDNVSLTAPKSALLRVDSYLDGMAVTPQLDTAVSQAGNTTRLHAGQKVIYNDVGLPIVANGAKLPPPDPWDQWVASRVALRQTDIAAALKASGLSAPVPELVELYKTGTFFSCPPLRNMLGAHRPSCAVVTGASASAAGRAAGPASESSACPVEASSGRPSVLAPSDKAL